MAGIFRRERDEGRSQGVGDKLAELWKELRLKVPSFAGVDDKPEERESIEQAELEEDEAFDDGRASIASFTTDDWCQFFFR